MTRVLADEQAFQFNSNPSVNPGNYNALYTSPCSPPTPCFSADHGLRSAVFTPLGLQSSTNLSGGDILAANAFGSAANQHVSTPPLQCMDHVGISPPIVATPQICSAHCVLDDKGSDLMRRNITKIIGDGAGEYANQAYLSDLQESEWKVDGLRTNMLCRSVPKVGLMAGYGNLEAILGGLRAPAGESENKDEMGSSFLCTDQGMLNVSQLHADHGGLQAYLEAGNILCGSSLSSKVAPMGGKADLGASVGGLAPFFISEPVQGGGDVDLLADDWRAYLGNRQAASHVGGYLQASLQYSQALQEGEDHGGISRSDASQIERDEGDLQAAAYLGDLQASIVAEARFLQRFLPSNEEEEGEEEELGQQQLLGGALFGCDDFRMYEFKVSRCMRERNHDWTQCPFAHPGEKARRRDPRLHQYSAAPCPDFRKATCKRGDACELSHGVFECWLHPSRYRTQLCKDGKLCKRKVCFFAHSLSQLRIAPPPNNANSSRPSTTTHLQQRPTTTAGHLYDGSPLRLAMAASQLIHGLPRHCSHSPASNLNHHVGAAPMFSPCHPPTGTAASSPFSYDHGSPLRMAMASSIHGLPATNDGNLEGFSSTNNHCLVGCPQSLNSSPLFSYDGSRLAPASDHGGFPCCKAPPNSAVFNGFGSMHSHSYGVSPSPPLNSSRHLSSDGSPRRLALAAPIDGFPRCNSSLNGGAFDGFIPINKFALCSLSNITHHIALPNSGLQLHSRSPAPPSLPLSPSESPPISSTTPSNWNNAPLAHRLSSLSGQAPSLDAVSQAQAILAAHALAQYQAVHGPSTPPVSPNARHHLDILNSMQGAVSALNTELINDQNPQNVIRSLHSPQAMANLIASLQQMELRCLAADEKNKMKFVHQSGNVPYTPSARVTQAEPWDGNGIGGSPLQRAELGGNLKARIGQEGPPEIKANLDLGWVNELVK